MQCVPVLSFENCSIASDEWANEPMKHWFDWPIRIKIEWNFTEWFERIEANKTDLETSYLQSEGSFTHKPQLLKVRSRRKIRQAEKRENEFISQSKRLAANRFLIVVDGLLQSLITSGFHISIYEFSFFFSYFWLSLPSHPQIHYFMWHLANK